MPDLGVYVNETATASAGLSAAESGIPYVVGTAPLHTAKKPAPVGVPVVCGSWEEAVEKLGYSEDWQKYTLCEAMYSLFKLYSCRTVIFCNMLDPAKSRTEAASAGYPVAGHKAILPYETLLPGLTVKADPGTEAPALQEGTDYSVFYDESAGACVVELLEDGTAYAAQNLTVESVQVKPSAVTEADIAKGVAQVDACLNRTGFMGSIDVALAEMINSMEVGMDFTSAASTAQLMAPKEHRVTVYSAAQVWNMTKGKQETKKVKYVFVLAPKDTKPGDLAPMNQSNASGAYSVYYYAAYENGEQLWGTWPRANVR